MAPEELEKRIKKLAEVSGLSEDDLRSAIEKKKEDAAGLLTDLGAVYALEKEYGVQSEIGGQVVFTDIAKLQPNVNNVNVVGAIKEIGTVKHFKGEKRAGKLSRIRIADNSGDIAVVFWDKNAEIVESDKIEIGTAIMLRNAYTKDALNGGAELHVGGLSRVLIDPQNLDKELAAKLPKIKEDMKKIAELQEGDITSVYGRVLYTYPKSEFDRSDGSKGQRASLIIEDESGKTRVVLWDASADKVENFTAGDVLKVENAQVRTGNRGTELHIGSRGRILPSDHKIDLPDAPQVETYKIADLQNNLPSVIVAGRVMRIFPIKEFDSGERSGKLASLILADTTGFSRAVLWNENADLVKDINQGDLVRVKNAYTKQSLNGDLELHLSSRGSLDINPDGIDIPEMGNLLEQHADQKNIIDINPEDRNIKVVGSISDVDENAMVFEICPECASRVENVAGEWLCDVCGEVKPSYSMVVSCSFEDDTGNLRAIFFRDLAEQLTGLSIADVMNIIGQTGDELEPVRQAKDNLVGNKLSLIGNPRYNDFSDQLELMVTSISSLEGDNASRQEQKKKEAPKEPAEDVESKPAPKPAKAVAAEPEDEPEAAKPAEAEVEKPKAAAPAKKSEPEAKEPQEPKKKAEEPKQVDEPEPALDEPEEIDIEELDLGE